MKGAGSLAVRVKKRAKGAPGRRAAPPQAKGEERLARERALRDKSLYSVQEFAMTFGLSEDTVAKAARAARVEPSRANGALLYHVRDLVDACFLRDAAGRVDPEKMDPYRRKAHYEGERNRLELAVRAGRLIPVDAHQAEVGRVGKILARGIEVLPDLVEREGLMAGAALTRLEALLDSVRHEIADEIEGKGEPAAR